MTRYIKAIAALAGALTPAIVIFVLGLAGVHVDLTLATGICTVAATLATIIAPANGAKPTV